MNRTNQHLGVVLIATFVILIIIAVALTSLSRMTSSVSAVAPPTPVPPFDGEVFTAVIDSSRLNQTPVNVVLANADWTEVLSETFEAGLDTTAGWTTFDNDLLTNGEYKWGTETFMSPTPGDSISAWAVGDGQDGGPLNINSDGYPDNVDSWLVYGPIDMSGVVSASLTFDYWLEVDGGDGFAVAVSTSGADTATFTGSQTFNTTPPNTWSNSSYDLSSVFGESTVYIGFNFTSDASGNAANLPGALLDNVQLLVRSAGNIYLPMIRKDATPTPSPTPIGGTDYRDDFTDDIDGWELRRADTQNKFEIYHGTGILNVSVEDPDDYIIVSPLVAAPSLPYSLEMSAQHKEPEEKDLYGLVFGADWDGTTCPNSDFSSCFETYYVLKVEYRTNDGTYLRFKLLRINSHTDNQPVDSDILIDWTKVSSDENDFNKWRVDVEADNDIKIYLNDVRVGSIRDNDLSGFIEPYFGVMVQTKTHGNFRGKFDYFDVSAQ